MTFSKLPPVPRCPLHPKYRAGCRDCQLYAKHIRRLRDAAIADGTYVGHRVDATPTRNRLRQLHRAHRMTWHQIGAASGKHPRYLQFVSAGRTPRVLQATEDAVMSVKPAPRCGRHRVDSTGTVRRLQALACMGYTWEELSTYCGVSRPAVQHWVSGVYSTGVVSTRTARTVIGVYDKFSMVPSSHPYAHRARRNAFMNGWYPPLAWDDESIDDPRSRPRLGPTKRSSQPDESVVWLVLHYQDPGRALNHAEKRLVVEHGTRVGMPHSNIADLLGIDPIAVHKSVGRRRQRERAGAA